MRWIIPDDWCWVRLGELAEVIGGGTPPTGDGSNFEMNGIPWITPADLTGYSETFIRKGKRSLSEKGYANSSAKIVPRGSVLLSSRAPVGYCVIAANELCTSQGFKTFVLKGSINPEYVRYYLLFSKNYLESISSGTTFKELSGFKASTISFPLAPLEEQAVIVNYLSGLNSKLQRTRSHLNAAVQLAETLKAKVLENAYSGVLTEEWRFKHKKFTPERVQLGSIISEITYGTSSKSSRIGKIPVLRMGNIQDGAIDWSDLVYTNDNQEIKKYILKAGDVLFNRTNSPELVGKTAVYKGEREAIYAGYLIRVRCSDVMLPDYLNICLNSPQGREFCRRVKSDGISQSNINATKLKTFILPLPSVEEQREIIAIIEKNFNRIINIINGVDGASGKLSSLETTFYSKAFSGELTRNVTHEHTAIDILDQIKLHDINANKIIIRKPKQTGKSTANIMKKLLDVLSEADEWLAAQEAFQRCGIRLDSTTEEIEPLYAELRALDKKGMLAVQPVLDSEGRKLFDRIKLSH
ncbi:type I restriction enzyme S subunit [Mucilaginibacter terrae]|nr:type I restriction enzyme S subunit [Mucilaginibacter terrae]